MSALTAAQVRERDALVEVCRYGCFTVHRRDGMWGAYQVLKRKGIVTMESIGAGRWRIRLAGPYLEAYQRGDDMTAYGRGEAVPS